MKRSAIVSLLTDLLERVRSIVFRRRDERELAEELRFHVEMEAESRRRAGVSPDEARRLGYIALGGMERTKEDVRDARGTRLLHDSTSDFWYTLRTLARAPGFTAAAILTLAIGIGGTTAVFSAVDAVLLQPLPYQQPGQLVRLYQADSGNLANRGFVTPVHFLAFRERMRAFESVAGILTYSETGADIGSGDRVRRIRLLPVTAEYFDVVGVHPAIGHGFTREDEVGPSMVVVSRKLFDEQLGGNPAAIGTALVMNGKSYTIAGVMPAGFSDPLSGLVDAWVPMDVSSGKDLSNADNHWISMMGRLRPGVPLAQAQAELDVLGSALRQELVDGPRQSTARLYALKEDIVGPSSRALEIMLGAVALVLVLVCVNIANLLLVRGSERAHEFAVRSAIGASKERLLRQMLLESLILAFAGDVVGIVLARVAMSAMVAVGAGAFPRLTSLTLEPRLLAFSLVVSTLCALGFGIVPALRAARTDPADTLRERGRAATGGGAQLRLRDWLVASQVALAFVLLVGAGLLVASFQRLRQVELGVNTAATAKVLVFELHLPEARYDAAQRGQFYDVFPKQVESISGVRAAGGVSRLPATGSYHQWGAVALTGPLANTPRARSGAEQRVISGDYLRAVGIPLLEGRAFDSRDAAGTPYRILVSRSFARQLFPGMSAIGQSVRTGGRTHEIIGVVGDVAVNAEGRPAHFIYHAHAQYADERVWSLTQVVATDGAVERVQGDVRRALASADPQLVMHKPMTLAEAIGMGEGQRAFMLRIVGSFAAVALGLAGLGLFGVLSYGVRLRAREFGIRMALGAEAASIRRMVLRQGLTVTAIGIVVGLAGAVALSRVMAAVVFQVSALDWRVLGGAVVFMIGVGGLAAFWPARRATGSDARTVLQ